MKNFLKVAYKLQIRKKTTIYNIIFISIAVLLVCGFYSYLNASKKYLLNDIYDVIYYRKLSVYKGVGVTDRESIEIDVRDYPQGMDIDLSEFYDMQLSDEEIEEAHQYTEEELEEIKEELESVEHIVNVVNVYSYWTILSSKELKRKGLNGEVEVYSANNDSLPEIVLGTNFPSEDGNYMVCPENFYPTDNLEENSFISSLSKVNINDYLNKKVTFSYSSNYQTTNYQIEYQIVGFYKNNESHFDENICYVPNASLKEIATNMYSDDIEEETGINNIVYQDGFIVQIDELDNVDLVKDKLYEMGYSSDAMAELEPSFFEDIQNNMKRYSLLILLLVFIILIIIFIKQIEEDKKNYKLLSFLGYKRRNIQTIYILSTIIQVCFSLIVSTILAIILFGILKNIVILYPFIFNKWTLSIDYHSILLVIFMMCLSLIINVIIGIFYIKRELNGVNNF